MFLEASTRIAAARVHAQDQTGQELFMLQEAKRSIFWCKI
jgi:hypothetical protein